MSKAQPPLVAIIPPEGFKSDWHVKPGTIEYIDLSQTNLSQMERKFITDRYWFCNNNQTRTAISLGIGRSNLRKKLREYGLL